MCGYFRTNFPEMYSKAVAENKRLKEKYDLEPKFGIFWNFCLNGPVYGEGINDVICEPHVDAKNGAIMLCAVLVFYIGKGEFVGFVL